MITDLKYYVGHQKSFLPKVFCDKILDEIKLINFTEHTFYNPKTKIYEPKSGEQELSVSWETTPSKTELTSKLWYAIDKYIKDIKLPWFSSWQGYTAVRFNKYEQNKKMAFHCDHIHSMFDGEKKGIPTLSVLGILNDDFKGGEFIMFNNYKIDLKKGDVLIFPSIFLYPHRVEPIKEGIRYSYISWVW